jgi:hypothetical protein
MTRIADEREREADIIATWPPQTARSPGRLFLPGGIRLMISINGVSDHVHQPSPRCGYATRCRQWPIRCVCNRHDLTWLTRRRARLHGNLAAVSFLALRDLMRAIGYSWASASVFPAIIDTAVAVSTLMIVALGDKPVRRIRTATAHANTQTPAMEQPAQRRSRSATRAGAGFCFDTTRPGTEGAANANGGDTG